MHGTGIKKTVPGVVTSVAPCIATKFLIYKTNICTSSTHNNKLICLLLHVQAELRHLQGVYTPLITTHYSIIHYSNTTPYCSYFCRFYTFQFTCRNDCAKVRTAIVIIMFLKGQAFFLFLDPQDEVGPSISSSVVLCSFVIFVYIVVLVLVVCLCLSSVHVLATFSGTVLFPLLCSVLPFFA